MKNGAYSLSGGIIWHLRAMRFSDDWHDFGDGLRGWLKTWQHNSANLLLLGPSAGWCLPQSFITMFGSIVAVDVDPFAPPLFKWRHGAAMRSRGTSITWLRVDVYDALEGLLKRYPKHAVLFCNLLGQHIVCSRNVEVTTQELLRVKRLLRERTWASFHDRLSSPWRKGDAVPRSFVRNKRTESLEVARQARVGGVWHDHLTGDILPDASRRHYFAWPITPRRMHIIEAGFSAMINSTGFQ